MGTAAGMIAEARALLGLGENPPGSNRNKVSEWYGLIGPWCDMTITWCATRSGNLNAVGGRFAYTVYHAQKFQSMGRWHYGLGGIKPGDVVFFDWSGSGRIAAIDHVGLVEAVNSDGTITTLEGNTSNKMMRRRRGGKIIVGYGRPAYDNTPPPANDGSLRSGSKGAQVTKLQNNLNKVMKSGLTADGDFGAKTLAAVKAFQTKYGLPVDGTWNTADARKMDAVLAGLSTPPAPKPRPPYVAKLVVDGDFGPATCAALQRALNARVAAGIVVDGSMDPQTRKALQKRLGVTQVGVVGPVTIKALQRVVGVTVDGHWGHQTTAGLQRKLNAGTF